MKYMHIGISCIIGALFYYHFVAGSHYSFTEEDLLNEAVLLYGYDLKKSQRLSMPGFFSYIQIDEDVKIGYRLKSSYKKNFLVGIYYLSLEESDVRRIYFAGDLGSNKMVFICKDGQIVRLNGAPNKFFSLERIKNELEFNADLRSMLGE